MQVSECAGNIDALIFRLLESPYTPEWWDATHALERLGHRVVPDLIQVIQDGTICAAAAAARILGDVGPAASAAGPVLLSQLDHPDHRVRDAAAHALARINPRLKQTATYIVDRFVCETDPSTRRGLLRVLGNIGPAAEAAIPHIGPALEEDDLFEDAVLALQSITRGETPSVLFLADRLRSPRTSVSCAAARALLAPAASQKPCRAALINATLGSDSTLEKEARSVLRKLERRQHRAPNCPCESAEAS